MQHDIVDKFSTHLKNVLTRALCIVVETKSNMIEPEHLFWAVGTEKGSISAQILRKVQIKAEQLRRFVGATTRVHSSVAIRLSDTAKRMLEKGVLTANIYGHRYIGTEHLLAGILQVPHPPLEQFFNENKTDLKILREQVALVLKSTSKFPDLTAALPVGNDPTTEQTTTLLTQQTNEQTSEPTPALDFFGRDLTQPEIQATIHPVIGREAEIERLMEVLCRKTKNNPLLVGEPGVGKTAIVEGLGKRIVEGKVPLVLQGKRLVALDLSLVVAGTMYRGEFESRLRQIVDETKKHPDTILFIDEIHTIVGAGAASGSLDAANMLKPALARGDIRCIGATTNAEYKKVIEADGALERRFQQIQICEPNRERTLQILQGVASAYETYHGIRIAHDALERAVDLSDRYLPEKHQPDKALDLVDEACASIRVHATKPSDADERRGLQRILQETRDAKRQAVVEERFLDAVALKEEEERIRLKLARATPSHPSQTVPVMTRTDVASVVSRQTGIPLAHLEEEDQSHLAQLETELSKRVIGQERAVSKVASALRRAKTGVSDPHRPLASFLFLGPTGVGKTELAKAIARGVFEDEHALVHLNMSEFSEGFTASKLIGAPAGYVGFREGAKLTDRVKERPYCVVLFDELEKAHRDVQHLLLQILEEGELTDATGRRVNFRNTVIVMTSNVGSERFGKSGIGFQHNEQQRVALLEQEMKEELKERFRAELTNRIDHICIFEPLTQKILEEIAEKQLRELALRLQWRHVQLTFDQAVASHVAAMCTTENGARDLRRHIQDHVESPLASHLILPLRSKDWHLHIRNGVIALRTRKRIS